MDFRIIIQSIDNLITNELEGYYEDKPNKHRLLKTLEMTPELYEEISILQLNLFLIHLMGTSRDILPELIRNKALSSFVSPQLQSLEGQFEKNPRYFYKKLEELKDSLYSDLFDHILHVKSIINKNPNESLLIFSNLIESTKAFSLPKVLKFIIQHILPSCYFNESSNFDHRFFFILFEQIRYISLYINRLSNIRPDEKTQSGDIFSIHNDFFKNLTKLELKEGTPKEKPSDLSDPVFFPYKQGLFTFAKLNYRVARGLKLEFCGKIYKILTKSLLEHLNLFLTKKTEIRSLFSVISACFELDKKGVEQMGLNSICYTLILNLEFYQLMKFSNEKFQLFTKEEIKLFIVKTLVFGLKYFAKSPWNFKEDIYSKKSNLKLSEKKLHLFFKACKYLQQENLINESLELASSYQTKKLVFSVKKKQEYFYLKQTRKGFYKLLFPKITYPLLTQTAISFIKTNVTKVKKINLYHCRKSLVLLIGNDIDRLKGFNCRHLASFKNELFSMEDKMFNEQEGLLYLEQLGVLSWNLSVGFFFRLRFAFSNENRALELLGEKITENPGYFLQFNHLMELFILRQTGLGGVQNLILLEEIFYWKIPHIQLLLKYISNEFEKIPILQIFFTKTLKRLAGEQLLYYLPQVFQVFYD